MLPINNVLSSHSNEIAWFLRFNLIQCRGSQPHTLYTTAGILVSGSNEKYSTTIGIQRISSLCRQKIINYIEYVESFLNYFLHRPGIVFCISRIVSAIEMKTRAAKSNTKWNASDENANYSTIRLRKRGKFRYRWCEWNTLNCFTFDVVVLCVWYIWLNGNFVNKRKTYSRMKNEFLHSLANDSEWEKKCVYTIYTIRLPLPSMPKRP